MPFNGVTKSGGVRRKAPESDARSALQLLSDLHSSSVLWQRLSVDWTAGVGPRGVG